MLRNLLRPGDALLLLLGLAAVWWSQDQTGGMGSVVIRQGERVFVETEARLNQRFSVPGPLGVTEVEIRDGRVRVLRDPSPRQLCVRQGWLNPGETAVCLPNRVSVALGRVDYDSLNY
jgi:hypothetical protein